MIYFTSDFHWGHKAVIKYSNRPFSNIGEMDNEIIHRYNSVVKNNDTAYILGDISFCKEEEANLLIKRLNGHKILILGNHDKKKKYKGFERIENLLEVKWEGERIILCHYPLYVWNAHHHGAWHLHAHCHGSLKITPPDYYERKVMDVGVDTNNFYPYSFEEIKIYMDQKKIIPVDHHGEVDE